MKSRSTNLKRRSSVRRQRDPIPWKYCLLTLVCGLVLVGGFFWGARQHFSSMDYSMKNAKLRQHIEDLKAEQRRLQLSREIALSPAEIKKAAKKLGLAAMTAKNIEVVGAQQPPLDQPRQAVPDDAAGNVRPVGRSDPKNADQRASKSFVEEKNTEKRGTRPESREKKTEGTVEQRLRVTKK